MIDRFFHSFSIIINPFILSTITAVYLCNLYKYPFISPKYSVSKIAERLDEMKTNLPAILGSSVTFTFIFYNRLLSNNAHDEMDTILHIALYSLLIEMNYYFYHRYIHIYGYQSVHKKHHQIVDVYPFDTFFLTYHDDLALVGSLGFPLLWIRVTFFEQFIVLYIYITCSYLLHSKLFWKHHEVHHRLLKYNYCILFPIFDIIFGTYHTGENNSLGK